MKRNRSKSRGSGERRRKNGSSERDKSKSESEEEEEEELPFESVSRKGYVPPSKRARKVHTPLRPKGEDEDDGGGAAAEGGGGKKKGGSSGDAMGVIKRPVKDQDEVDKTKGASFEVKGAPPTPPTPRPPTPAPKVPAVEEERPEVEKSDPGERREESQEAEVNEGFFRFSFTARNIATSVQARPGAKEVPVQEELEREGKAAEPSDGGKGLLRNQTKESKPPVKVEKEEPSPPRPAAPKSAGPPPPGKAKIAAAAPDVVKIDQEPPEPAPPPAKQPPREGVPSPKEPIPPKASGQVPPSLGRMSLFEEVVDAGGREEPGAVGGGREGEEGTTCTDDDYD